MNILSPCPFCGSEHIHAYWNAPSSDRRPWLHVSCLICGAGHSTIEMWNTRRGEATRCHDSLRYRWLRDTPGIKTYIQGFAGSGRISGIDADVEIDGQMRNPL